MLLLPVAVIGLTLRQRMPAAAASVTLPVPPPPVIGASRPHGHPVVPDPFTGSLLALGGPGAADLARLITLSALEGPGDDRLVVLPRADAAALFGLDEDELLDESPDQLFLPGTLDAALAFLETELRIRDDSEATGGEPKLLLVADCEQEAGRIAGLFARHPQGLSAVVLGGWPGEQAAVDENGLVSAPPAVAGLLPKQASAMSRAEARHRLDLLTEKCQGKSTRPKRRRHR
ncbi:hypothetical protein SAMN04489712_113160 [Thermomonospora echinospora]|uniref:Uncharacterized protein n=1 Tax=Thermomonospora echinospora TaxID=1992 RepID=A0A1H6D7K4_9ACTN|nr:hypothetical protein [Thermomonospora echinospora]SEG80833.1 hypothetical protein SAMN04489712_113160 [Thermomonospora echinospora]